MTTDAVLQGEVGSVAQRGAAAIVGSWLRQRRIKDGWTVQSLATQVEMGPERLQQIEAGAERMSVDELIAFARLFKVPVSSFFGSGNVAKPQETPPVRSQASPGERPPETPQSGTPPEVQHGARADDLALAAEIVVKFAQIGNQGFRNALLMLLNASRGLQ